MKVTISATDIVDILSKIGSRVDEAMDDASKFIKLINNNEYRTSIINSGFSLASTDRWCRELNDELTKMSSVNNAKSTMTKIADEVSSANQLVKLLGIACEELKKPITYDFKNYTVYGELYNLVDKYYSYSYISWPDD